MPDTIASLFRRLTHGVYVIGAAADNRHTAFTAAWLMQVSFDPLMLAVSVNPDNSAGEMLSEGAGFTVNVLKRGQLEIARRFGIRSQLKFDRFDGVGWKPGVAGAPMLDGALAVLECRVAQVLPAGDHHLVVGRVIGGKILDARAEPMNYVETGDMDGSDSLYPREF